MPTSGGTQANHPSTFLANLFSKRGVKSDRKGMARSRSLDELVFEEVGNTTTATTTAIPPQGRESQPHRHSTTSHPLDMSGREGQQERNSQILPMSTHCRQSPRNSSTLRIEMPTSGERRRIIPPHFSRICSAKTASSRIERVWPVRGRLMSWFWMRLVTLRQQPQP